MSIFQGYSKKDHLIDLIISQAEFNSGPLPNYVTQVFIGTNF